MNSAKPCYCTHIHTHGYLIEERIAILKYSFICDIKKTRKKSYRICM